MASTATKKSRGKARAVPHRHVALIAGEPSGDALGGRLMAALRDEAGADLRFTGVGGELMQAQGLSSLFPFSEITHHGVLDILVHLPGIVRRIRETVDAVVRSDADVLVIIDSPEFTHAVARRVRKRRPDLPILNYVPPTVWAWRPGRAKRMRGYIDRSLALLPFEPEVQKELGGPPCAYVGHPLMGRLKDLRGPKARKGNRATGGTAPVLVVLPGSRHSEVRRLMGLFGETVERMRALHPDLRVVLPAFPAVRDAIEDGLASWPVKPEIVSGEKEKFAAFQSATAALAASGTVTLELALARVPMVVAYRVDPLAFSFRWLLLAHSFVMPNLVIGRNAIPEFLNKTCTTENLANALAPVLTDTPERRAQLDAFAEVEKRMATGKTDPAHLAAREVLAAIGDRLRAGAATS